jgi:hypothetical protein
LCWFIPARSRGTLAALHGRKHLARFIRAAGTQTNLSNSDFSIGSSRACGEHDQFVEQEVSTRAETHPRSREHIARPHPNVVSGSPRARGNTFGFEHLPFSQYRRFIPALVEHDLFKF